MFWRKVGVLVWKDLLLEFRSKQMISSMLIFSFLVIVIFAFAFNPVQRTTQEVLPGIIWVAFTFAGVLGLNRAFAVERDNDCLLGLMLAPVDRTAIYVAKVTSNFIFTGLTEIVSFPLFLVFFNYHLQASLGWLVLTIFLGTLGFVAVGTFLAALASNTRMSEILLPLMVFPVMVPVLIAAVEATSTLMSGGQWQAVASWLRLLGVYDIIFLAVAYVLFDYCLEV
ncbi:MAG: transcriptional regulator [Clostridia bacterium]|nr:MAG: transcriptional regulator [Clostridia bacterium]